MTSDRFTAIAARYPSLRIAVAGDFCLDRYLEIDPARSETSLETGLPVHNVVAVRAQPGAAGTILNNLVALGIGEIHPIGFAGEDGEGFELRRALAGLPGIHLDHFIQTPLRRTFTYCKPLLLQPGQPPVELNRLDSKNWTPTPQDVIDRLGTALTNLAPELDALILLDQVNLPETGIITRQLLETVDTVTARYPQLLIIADSRRGLRDYPPVALKMNAAELAALAGSAQDANFEDVKQQAVALARKQERPVFVTVAERGLIGAGPDGIVEHLPALPVRGPLDIVGAGDACTANLAAALAAGATLREALEIANSAASVVIHKLGTTGTASIKEIGELMPH